MKKQRSTKLLATVVIPTADGKFVAHYSERGLAVLGFPGAEPSLAKDASQSTSAKELSPELSAWHRKTVDALQSALNGRRPATLPPIDLSAGTEFQQQVWRAMAGIETGQTRSYGELARLIKKPGATRAIGNACGANPIPVLIPCHRVLAAGGKLGGFSGGLEWKRLLLAREGINLDGPGASGTQRQQVSLGHTPGSSVQISRK